MKEMLKLGFILAAYAVVSCVGLAFVYRATAPAIEAAKSREINASLNDIFPDAADFTLVENGNFDNSQPVKIQQAYLAQRDGTVHGLVIQAVGPTYASSTILVGVDMNRRVTGIKFVEMTDSAGIGTRAMEPKFYNQFTDKSVDDAYSVGSDVDNISGATITSRGVANIVKFAGYTAGQYLADNYGGAAGSGAAPVFAAAPEPVTFEEACTLIFPGAEFETLTEPVPNTITRSVAFRQAVLVRTDGTVTGLVINARGPSYKDGAAVAVGITVDRTIAGIRITETTDTKNIGDRVVEEEFWSQFTGKSVDDAMLVHQDVDAISGATVSSSAIANIVKITGYEGADYLALNYKGSPAPAGSSKSFALNVVDPEM
ncbi:MAG: FMN-binding protein [Spirochaetaceae bacterium]|jgi:electron transport complex protein RnfG|nr:FMN-binding protein [Spirochaetaceae bacterium]